MHVHVHVHVDGMLSQAGHLSLWLASFENNLITKLELLCMQTPPRATSIPHPSTVYSNCMYTAASYLVKGLEPYTVDFVLKMFRFGKSNTEKAP